MSEEKQLRKLARAYRNVYEATWDGEYLGKEFESDFDTIIKYRRLLWVEETIEPQ